MGWPTDTVNARLARELVRTEPGEAEILLDEVRTQANQALDTLRDLARGIFPPALVDRGLVAALEAHLVITRRPARFDSGGFGRDERFAPDVEAAVYFCCLEALQNCAKHAPEATIRISLQKAQVDWLLFSVQDDGPGFDPASVPAGSGRHNMADRLAALDGTLQVCSAPGQGTTVSGRLPAAPVAALSLLVN